MTPDKLCFTTELSSTELASWVQAIGSIMAIVAAIVIGAYQSWATRKAVVDAQQLKEGASQRSIMAVADAAYSHAQRIGEAMEKPDEPIVLYQVYDKSIVDGVVRALTDAPVYEVGSRDGILALLSLRDQFVFLGIAIEAFIAGPAKDPHMRRALDTLMEPADGPQRMAVVKQGKTVLARNVSVHLDKIRDDYSSLKRVLTPWRAP